MRHSRGFGVQSPSDYRFIRYVVNEHWPYYAYDEIKTKFSDIDKDTLRLCRLYLRIANWRQPEVIFDYCPSSMAYAKYMQAGCRRSRVMTFDDAKLFLEQGLADVFGLCRMSLVGDYRMVYEKLMELADSRSVLIIENISCDKTSKSFWREVCDDSRTGVTFDLYYCGIVFFNKQRYKQHYIVNF